MDAPSTVRDVSGITKATIGVCLPVALLIVFDIFLFHSVNGKGDAAGLAGLSLFSASFVIVPAIFIINALILTRRWRHISVVLLLGFALPTVAAVKEYLFLYGH